jgi:hypothetical protein
VIKDVHSMHGTQINDEKLPANAPQVVKIGDVLSFGAEVRRGPEVFPPCKFRINYEFMPWTLVSHPYINTLDKEDPVNICLYSRGFQFPDSSDIEDEQDHSEEEAQVEDSQEEEMTPVETPPRKQSTLIDAIDLTSDDVEPAEPSNGPQGLSAEEIAADKHVMGQSAAPIVIEGDSDEEDEDDEDDSEAENQQLDYADSEEVSDDDSDKENNEESDESHDEAADACGNDWENSELLDTESNLDTSQVSDIAPMSACMFHDNKDIPVSSIRTTAGGSTEDPFHGDIHFGKSANTAAWDEALSEENEDESSQDEDFEDHLPSDTGSRSLPPLGQSFPQINTVPAPTTGSYVWPNMVASASNHALLPQALSPIRQPSPSDAAMAKSQTINPVQIHHVPGNQFSNFMAHTLGEKSGKKDFFEAREINRARVNDEESRYTEYSFMGDGIARPKFNQPGHPYNPRPPAPGPMQNTGPQQAQYLQRQQHLAQQVSREKAFAQPRNLQQHMAFTQQFMQQRMAQAQVQAQQHAQHAQKMMTEQNAFQLGSPLAGMPIPSTFAAIRQQPSVEPEVQSPTFVLRAPSPELDMTSAAKFNESKAAIAAVQPGRSAVRINDIVEPLAAESDVKSLKRKASDISDVLEEEVRIWASIDSSVSRAEVINSSDMEAQTENTSQQQISGSAEALPPSTSVDPPTVEPAHKRIKKFAEVVGYTALGGLAGGVALFSALVATAPDFL